METFVMKDVTLFKFKKILVRNMVMRKRIDVDTTLRSRLVQEKACDNRNNNNNNNNNNNINFVNA